jgi:hypothetical protein
MHNGNFAGVRKTFRAARVNKNSQNSLVPLIASNAKTIFVLLPSKHTKPHDYTGAAKGNCKARAGVEEASLTSITE